MTDDGFMFVTFCRKCGVATNFQITKAPQTAAELEEIRQAVATKCPDHGTMDLEEARRRVDAGEYEMAPAVAAELRDPVLRAKAEASLKRGAG